MAFKFDKTKEPPKSYRTKHQDKHHKYERPKPNKCTKKAFQKSRPKINQYYDLKPMEKNEKNTDSAIMMIIVITIIANNKV